MIQLLSRSSDRIPSVVLRSAKEASTSARFHLLSNDYPSLLTNIGYNFALVSQAEAPDRHQREQV